MRRSIATVSLSGTLPEKLDAIAAAGFDGVELFEPDFTYYAASASDLRRMCEDKGLAIELFQPFRDYEGMPGALHQRDLARAERKFDLMEALGTRLVLVCSNTSPAALPDPELAAEQLHELAERAALRGIRIAFEALSWGRHVRLWRQAWDIVELAAHPELGLVLDSFHTLALKDDPAGIAQLPGDRIFFVQMADAPRLDLSVIEWARHHRNFPGQGQFDTVGFFECIMRAGYRGPLSLEVFNDVFRASPNRRIAVDAMRSLRWLEAEVWDRLKTTAGEASHSRSAMAQLARISPMPTCDGIAFVEFAVDDEAAESLGALLLQMGFRLAGEHRSKPVSLYRQGEINFILNRLSHPLAQAHFAAHGPSSCAWGLLCENAVLACHRAVELQSARFDPEEGPGEHRLPSIVAPGGGIIHFVDRSIGERLFDVDFRLQGEPPADESEPGLTKIDHLAMALAPDRLDTWVLFCRAVLGMQAGDRMDLPDPYGLVRNFGMADPERRLRLVLNVSPSQRTRTAQVASGRGGATVHHIALVSEDIFQASRKLRHRGVRFIPISDNYYNDLPNRFDLSPEFVELLRGHGILFDRNADGDYLHVYTEPFASRFMFEVVQRLAGYDAYGASNAPARMASQAQEQPPLPGR
jgi:4-hydroxyphenylpyruvate dioxygenase